MTLKSQMIERTGYVISGMQRAKQFLTLKGYESQFIEQLGYEPYPGTLNIDFDHCWRQTIEARDPIVIDEWSDGDQTYGAVDCYPARVTSEASDPIDVHIVVPRRTDHDASTIELLAPVNLRKTLGVADGDQVTVSVESE